MSIILYAKDQAVLQAFSCITFLVTLEITQSCCGGFSQKQGLWAVPAAQVVGGLCGMQGLSTT